MRIFLACFALAAASFASANAHAADEATASAPKLSTAETPLGNILDNPAAKAILEKYLPDLVKSDSIEMARGLTLKTLQGYAADMVTDAKLAAIDAELAKIPAQ